MLGIYIEDKHQYGETLSGVVQKLDSWVKVHSSEGPTFDHNREIWVHEFNWTIDKVELRCYN